MMYALKEWQVINDAILEGKQSVLVRKGGILDSVYDFPPDKKEFYIFPTYEHQKKEYIKKEFHYLFKTDWKVSQHFNDGGFSYVKINLLCRMVECIQIKNIDELVSIYSQVIYTPEFLKTRFNYRPEEPLNIIRIIPQKLDKEFYVEYREDYRGCKSWIKLSEEDLKIQDGGCKHEQLGF